MVEICSYAQNFEDVMLSRALAHVRAGFYIDLGAQDPTVDSVSRAFYELGWRGVHVEPNSAYAELLRKERPDETVVQAAVAAHDGMLRFFEIADTGLSTADPVLAERHAATGHESRAVEVPCITLDTLLARYADRDIHWLKIDVEGYEKEVLAGWTVATARPWIVVVESTVPLTQEQSTHGWEDHLLGLGYERVYSDGLNAFYVSVLHPELRQWLQVPPNVFDRFVLSGTATSTFTARLNAELAAERARHELESQALGAALEQLESRARAATEEAAALRAQLDVAQMRLNSASREMARARAEIAGLEDRFAEARMQARNYREAGERSDAEREALHARLDETSNSLGDVQRRVAMLENEVRVRDAALSEARARATQLESAYALIAHSRSWRITAPLRHVAGVARRGRAASSDALRTLWTLPTRARRSLVARALDHLRSHPAHKALVVRMVRPFGSLDARLRAVAADRTAIPVAPGKTPPVRSLTPGPDVRTPLQRRMDYVIELERQLDEAKERHDRETAKLLREIEQLRARRAARDDAIMTRSSS